MDRDGIRSSGFAELSSNRMITDIGPSCPDCDLPDGKGMWVYMVPSEHDWTHVAPAREGSNGSVAACCAGCHRHEYFDATEPQCDNIQRVRAVHSRARDFVGGIYGVVSMRGADGKLH